MKIKTVLSLFAITLSLSSPALGVETEGVVVTIKPLHSLVSGVMGDTGDASLLLKGDTSPHDFQLKPSQIRAMNRANVVFYIGNSFETFLTGAFASLPAHVRKASMTQKAGLVMLSHRDGGAWEAHLHEEHDSHDDHNEPGEHEGHGHEEHENHADNMHVWLSPENASRMVTFIAKELSAIYPENGDVYAANAEAYIKQIDALDEELKLSLSGLKDKPFIVFHDAYQYYERAYDLSAVGSITLEPDEAPSPSRISEVKDKLLQTNAKCVFREPQFSDRLINTVIDGTNAKRGTLDPLGVDLDEGADSYFSLMRDLAKNLKQCLK
jgi:zinc transport system substrate-binding protein